MKNPIINIEFKARAKDLAKARKILHELQADYRGIDKQIDTYFNCQIGRLKLREGNIENSLIHYVRANTQTSKESQILLHKTNPESSLKEILIKANGILVIVEKQREIYFVDNVKIHLDEVKNLGTFIEVEAIDENANYSKEKLQAQCDYFQKIFAIKNEDFIAESYSDMIIKENKK